MIRQLVVILFSSILLVQASSFSFSLLLFKLNQDTIADLWCVNKSQPELLCSGQCYFEDFTAELVQEDAGDQTTAPTLKERIPTTLISISSPLLEDQFLQNIQSKRIAYLFSYAYLFSDNILHPPQL